MCFPGVLGQVRLGSLDSNSSRGGTRGGTSGCSHVGATVQMGSGPSPSLNAVRRAGIGASWNPGGFAEDGLGRHLGGVPKGPWKRRRKLGHAGLSGCDNEGSWVERGRRGGWTGHP